MKINRLIVAAVVIGAQFYTPYIRAAETPNIDALLQRIDELEQKVKVLERNREVDQEISTEKSKGGPSVVLGSNGLVVRSADTNFVMNIHGYAQTDGRFYLNDRNTVNDTFLLRRVRPIIEGTVYEKFDYRLMLDIATGNVTGSSAANNALIDDAYVNAKFFKQFQVQVGKYKSPVGLERLKSTADLIFVETGFATQLTPNYDTGVEIHNDLFNSPINYAIGIFNGAADAASDDLDTVDQGKDIAGRIFAQPFLNTDKEALRGLGFGVGGSMGRHQGTLPSYRTPGQQTFFSYATTTTADGTQYRIDPQFYYYWGPFGILGEYILSSQKVRSSVAGNRPARFDNTAWQVEASYFITGEQNSFKTISPLHPFGPANGGWGALEIAARVEQLSLDKDAFPNYAPATSAKEATSWGVGVNWYLNRNVKVNLDYEQTSFRGGSKAKTAVTARPESVILSRVQFAF
ncbi:MAG: oprP [Pedosphaera sp.]|nr:oprP [Pedosphaera sp.]